jgi:hypothetical protein
MLQFAGRTYRRSAGNAQSPRLRYDTPPPQGWRQSIPISFSSGRSCHTSRLRRLSAGAFREEGALRPGIEMRTRHLKIQARLADAVQVAVLLGDLPTRLPEVATSFAPGLVRVFGSREFLLVTLPGRRKRRDSARARCAP